MIELRNDQLSVSFTDVHPEAKCTMSFQRTLRVPDDNQEYPLPAGLGDFPILPVDDFDVPAAWKQHGGVFFPMYQSEAMWISFSASGGYPFAVKIAAGKINAVTGKAWSSQLSSKPQNYVVIPEQPWLDGFCAAPDTVRQFVAMPLGEGITAEEQITGEAEWGGLQLMFYPMKADEYRKRFKKRSRLGGLMCRASGLGMGMLEESVYELGLAPGGRIQQAIAEDPYGIDVWDTSVSSRCFVHLLNSNAYREVTGQAPPTEPITAEQYADAHVPWFDYYQEGKTLPGSSKLAALDGVASAFMKKGKNLDDNKPIAIAGTINISRGVQVIREGEF
jgi:hypothetical protein